jgi:hypothetical protein
MGGVRFRPHGRGLLLFARVRDFRDDEEMRQPGALPTPP